MFFFFHRGDAVIRCEVRTDRNGDAFELVIDRWGALPRVERFRRAAELNDRWRQVRQGLISEGWCGPQPTGC